MFTIIKGAKQGYNFSNLVDDESDEEDEEEGEKPVVKEESSDDEVKSKLWLIFYELLY